jgi:uncharacterized protein (TIGR02996 family)
VTEDDWWVRVDESPDDPDLFMFFADWLGDHGEPREGAAREVARRGWVPYRYPGGDGGRGDTWDWYREDYFGHEAGKAAALLRPEVFEALPSQPGLAIWRKYSTPADAYRALLGALAENGHERIQVESGG